jgi:hypothetical protein
METQAFLSREAPVFFFAACAWGPIPWKQGEMSFFDWWDQEVNIPGPKLLVDFHQENEHTGG